MFAWLERHSIMFDVLTLYAMICKLLKFVWQLIGLLFGLFILFIVISSIVVALNM